MKDWKDDILESAKGIIKPAPPSDSFDRVLSKIKTQDFGKKESNGWIAIAAAVSIIVLINAIIISGYTKSEHLAQHDRPGYSIPLVTDYNIYRNE